jgi:hypothetical protein
MEICRVCEYKLCTKKEHLINSDIEHIGPEFDTPDFIFTKCSLHVLAGTLAILSLPWFSSVPSGHCWNSTLIRPLALSSKSLWIHQWSYHPTLCSSVMKALLNNHKKEKTDWSSWRKEGIIRSPQNFLLVNGLLLWVGLATFYSNQLTSLIIQKWKRSQETIVNSALSLLLDVRWMCAKSKYVVQIAEQ